jgi:ferric-dicitrate binding protein FerR (iron transport regulator)
MKHSLRVLLVCWGLALGLVPLAQAADALDRAIHYAEFQQVQALGAVAAAERALAEAQADLRVNRGIEVEARRARDPAAIAVAGEAVQQAQALERETERNLAKARSVLALRNQSLENLRSWTRADRRPGAVMVTESGEVRHRTPGGYEPQDVPALRAGERIETGPGARARLFLSGGDAEVVVGPSSSYMVTQDDASTLVAELESGLMRLRAYVHNTMAKKFEVRTPSFAMAVRGTDFSAARTPAGDRVQVYSGVVAVTPAAGGEEVLVRAGQFLQVPPQGPWPAPQAFQPGVEDLAWEAAP